MDGFEAALRILPAGLRQAAERLPREDRHRIEEFRLRRGRAARMVLEGRELPLPGGGEAITEGDLRRVLELCTHASPYAAAESLREGYATAEGGVRVGFGGEVILVHGDTGGLRRLSSAAIRVPREVKGCAAPLLRRPFRSTLIVSPPGAGKTTLLRDMLRLLSDGGLRAALCDERGEVAAFSGDGFGFDVGEATDVLTGGSKSRSAMMALRSLGAQLLAMDEITAEADAAACRQVSRCGVLLLATAHGESVEDLRRKPLYRELLDGGVFERAVIIRREGQRRSYEEERIGGGNIWERYF